MREHNYFLHCGQCLRKGRLKPYAYVAYGKWDAGDSIRRRSAHVSPYIAPLELYMAIIDTCKAINGSVRGSKWSLGEGFDQQSNTFMFNAVISNCEKGGLYCQYIYIYGTDGLRHNDFQRCNQCMRKNWCYTWNSKWNAGKGAAACQSDRCEQSGLGHHHFQCCDQFSGK